MVESVIKFLSARNIFRQLNWDFAVFMPLEKLLRKKIIRIADIRLSAEIIWV
jgi:hypothetical protein